MVQNCVYKKRQEKGVTQEEVAKTLSITRQTIIAIEKGNYTPSVQLALQLAKYFNVSVEELFKLS